MTGWTRISSCSPNGSRLKTYSLSFKAIGCKDVPEQITGIPENKSVTVAPDTGYQEIAVWSPSAGEITDAETSAKRYLRQLTEFGYHLVLSGIMPGEGSIRR